MQTLWCVVLLVLVPASVQTNIFPGTSTQQILLTIYPQLEPEVANPISSRQSELTVQFDDEQLWGEIYQRVSQSTYYGYLFDLSVTIGPRDFPSPENDAAVAWVESTMASISSRSTIVEIWGNNYPSVVGILEGYNSSLTDIIVIGAHMDSVHPDCPGADDNASGTAFVLELLRVLSQYQLPRDIYFMAFNAEEDGLLGSAEICSFLPLGTEIRMMFNADMLLYDPGGIGQREYIYYRPGNDAERFVAELLQNISCIRGTDVFYPEAAYMPFSDHDSFHENGHDALCIIERAVWKNPYYHTEDDRIDQISYNFALATEVTASVAVAAAQLALEGVSSATDFDNDNVTDLMEIFYRTNVTNPDTDGDGLLDGDELNIHQTSPLNPDSDKDGLPDYAEIHLYPTNPVIADSDYDQLLDGEEILIWGTDPLKKDTDGDGLFDYYEIVWFKTDPLVADTDLDGLSDEEELRLGTNATLTDSDDDSIPDGEEVEHGWNPLDPESPGDIKTSTSSSSDAVGFLLPSFLLSLLVLMLVNRRK